MKEFDAKIRINIDDLGLFHGVELGALELAKYGHPIYCSWLTNYLAPSEEFKKSNTLKPGLHFNLLEGLSHSKSTYLCDKQGKFNRRWIDFLYPSQKLRLAVEGEFEQQLAQYQIWFQSIHHIDTHLHLHSIPWIFKFLQKQQEKLGFDFLRNPYQSLTDDLSIFVKPGMLAKIMLLRCFALMNGNTPKPCYGISRLFQVRARDVLRFGRTNKSREIVLHAAKADTITDFTKFRFINPSQLTMRQNELDEMHSLLRSL